MTFLVLLLAATAGAFFHFAFRKSLDGGGRANIFQLVQCFFAFVIVTLINVKRSNFTHFDFGTINLGFCEGVLYIAMMWALGSAFKKGPPGLSVATLNSASVIPAILMAGFFGIGFGHGYTFYNGLGSFLVVIGLFMAAKSNSGSMVNLKVWAICATLGFAAHSIYLSIFQWRALLLKFDTPLPHFNLDLSTEGAHWFQSIIFLSAFVLLAINYILKDRTPIQRRELFWGMWGGFGNGLCTFSLVCASEIATKGEKAMIFPISGVLSILLCALWGKMLYKEKVDWKALSICLTGLVVGTVDWTSF